MIKEIAKWKEGSRGNIHIIYLFSLCLTYGFGMLQLSSLYSANAKVNISEYRNRSSIVSNVAKWVSSNKTQDSTPDLLPSIVIKL